VRRFSIPIGPARSLLETSLAISPDGTELAYTIDGRLFRRSMDELASVRMGSELQAASSCFFVNPEWVGCGHRGKLLKVVLATGASVALCDTPGLFGATGLGGDSIVFVPGAARGLWHVPSQGGERTVMLVPDFAKGERSYRWPAALPENRGLLFAMLTTENASFDDARIIAFSPGGKDRAVVASGGTFPRYAATGHVLFARSGNLHAIPFDLKDRKPTGAAKVVLEGILMDPLDGGACFDISEDGTLVYVPGGVISRNADIVWVDRSGNREPILTSEPVDRGIRVSPDGTRLAFNKRGDIWVCDLALRSQTRITSDAAIDTNPVWSPDGQRIAFASNRAGDMDIYERSADGTGAEVALLRSSLGVRPLSWSPDGKTLLFEDLGPTTGTDIKLLVLLGEGKTSVRDFAATAFNERQASFSPDGKWIAYVSDDSGEFDVYIQSSDGTARRRKVSTNGGTEPLWNPKGGELVFFKGQTVLSVSVQTAPTLTVSAPRTLFKAPAMITSSRFRNVDISRDGSRIVMMVPIEDPRELEIRVVLNWFEELKARVPRGR
jgi:WD40 repeat protein